MSREHRYDAFISYRHITPDKPLAEYLQRLLEAFSPPEGIARKKLHVFRDETELPTSDNLSHAIEEALEQSRYLIVVCSAETEKSQWCMQEIAYFKQLHGGKNDHIITLLAGAGNQVHFPAELMYETFSENGVNYQREVEPLAANACAETLPKAKKKLKTEYLRIAAALLGCGYDDLYRRDQRRTTRRRIGFISAGAGVMAVIAVISIIALITIAGQKDTIEREAHNLNVSQTQILVKESKELAESGDIYSARETLIQALPDKDNGVPLLNSALDHAVTLSGAYRRELFTAVGRLAHESSIQRCLLLENGTRLVTVGSDSVCLWDTGTKELVKKFEKTYARNCFFYTNQAFRSLPMRFAEEGRLTYDTEGSLLVNTALCRDFSEKEEPLTESAFYLLDDKARRVSRISPTDGSAVWEYEGGEQILSFYSFSDSNASEEAVVIKAGSDLLVLSAADGSVIVSCAADKMANYKNFWYSQNYLIAAGGQNIAVFRRDGSNLQQAFVSEKTDALLSDISYCIAGDVLYLNGEELTDSLFAEPFLAAYSLSSGKRLWQTKCANIGGGNSFITYFGKEQTGADKNYVVSAVGNCLCIADASTGQKAGELMLAGNCLTMYCSENGKAYFITANKSEICLNLTQYKGDDPEQHLFRTNRFDNTLALAAYSGGVYAGVKANSSDAYLIRTAENPNCTVLYEAPDGIGSAVFSPDGSRFALSEGIITHKLLVGSTGKEPKELAVKDTDSCSFAFWGNNRLVLDSNNTVTVYDADTLQSAAAFEEVKTIRYDMNDPAFSTRDYLVLLKKDGTLTVIDSTLKPILELAGTDYFDVSPSGNRILTASMDATSICNTATGESVKLADENLYPRSAVRAWSADEKTFCLLTDNTVHAYDCESGKVTAEGSYSREIKNMVSCCGSLCLLDADGNLVKVSFENGALVPHGELPLRKNISYSAGFGYRSADAGGKGLLRFGDTAWLIDEENFERCGMIENFRALSDDGHVISECGDALCSFPLLGEDALLSRLKALL